MPSNLDALDDILFQPTTKAARVVGRFQPKIGRLHKKERPITSSAVLPEATTKTIIRPCSSTPADPSSKLLVPHDLVLNGDRDSKKDIERSGDEVAMEPMKKPFSGLLVTQQSTHPTNNPHLEAAISDTGGDLPAKTRSDREADAVPSNLEVLDDILFQPVTKTARAVGRFQPKISSVLKNEKPITPYAILPKATAKTIVSPSSTTPPDSYSEFLVTNTLVPGGDGDSQKDLERSGTEVAVVSSTLLNRSAESLVTQESTHPTNDPRLEAAISDNRGAVHPDLGISGREAEVMTSNLDALDDILFQPATKTVRAVGRFQPKISSLRKNAKTITPSTTLPGAAAQTIVRPNSTTHTNHFSEVLVTQGLVPDGDRESENDLERLRAEVAVESTAPMVPSSEPLVIQDSSHPTDDPHLETGVSESNVDMYSNPGISGREAEVMTSDLDAFDDILFQPATKTVRAVGRFQPKISSLHKNAKTITPSTTLLGAAAQTRVRPNSTTPVNHFSDVLVTQGLVPDGDRESENDLERLRAEVAVESTAPMDPSSEPLVIQDSTHPTNDPHLETRVSKSNVDMYIDPGISGREAADLFSSLESLDDFLLQPTTITGRTVDKFQPKLTGQPTSEKCIASFSIVPDAADCISPPSDPPLHASNTLCLEEYPTLPVFPIDSLTARSCISAPLNPSSEDDNVDLQKDLQRSEKEVALSSALESIDDILFEPPTSTVRAVGKFRPKLISLRKDKKALSLLSVLSDAPESISPRNEGFKEGSNHSVIPPSDSVECSTIDPCNPIGNPHSEAEISNGYVDLLMDHGRLGREVTEAFSGLESLDNLLFQPATTAARGVGKFQPKFNAETKKVAPSSPVIPHESIESHPSPGDAQFLLSEIENLEASTSFSHDSFVGFSTTSPCDSAPADHPSELLMTQEVVPGDLQNVAGTSGKDSASSRKRKSSTKSKEIVGNAQSRKVIEHSQGVLDRGHVLASGEEHETGKSSRKLRKRVTIRDPVDEIEDGPADSGELPAETSDFSVMDAENDHDDEYRGEDTSKQKRAPRKSKRLVSENEKPARRCKKASEACDPSNKKPPRKKFTHSTRRSRTLVDKDLLNKPEEEIDPRKLIMKDLILLAETKERKMHFSSQGGVMLAVSGIIVILTIIALLYRIKKQRH